MAHRGQGSEPRAFLERIDNPNPDVRWRGANDLAQTLPRDPKLAADPDFALKLDQRLDAALKVNEANERDLNNRLANLAPEQKEAERARLRQEREYIQYLIACVGHFIAPTAVPILRRVAEQDDGMDPAPLERRRRQALFSLAMLGQNAAGFPAMRLEDRSNLMNKLDKLRSDANLTQWAEPAWKNLQARDEKRGDSMGIEETLRKCGGSDDPVLREYTAWVANFWNGTDKENAVIDAVLTELLHDNGRGHDLSDTLAETQPNAAVQPRETPGYIIRINAALALCRRGSHQIDKELGFLAELLDEQNLDKHLRESKNGQEEPNRYKVQQTIVETLAALKTLHVARPDLDLSPLRPAIEVLTKSTNNTLAAKAKETLLALDKKSS